MPSLKDLHCSIELGESGDKLPEYGTTYADWVVETFVAVPSGPKEFAVRLSSSAYITEGLAMYVYIDGVYQCNRNRRGLQEPRQNGKPASRRSLVNFLVRQKEQIQKDGSMIARPWAFEKLNTVDADQAPENCSPNIVDNVGCIEVVVLRCKGSRVPKSMPSINGFDGANDVFSLDGQSEGWDYDDRNWPAGLPPGHRDNYRHVHPSGFHQSHPASRHVSPHRQAPRYDDERETTTFRITNSHSRTPSSHGPHGTPPFRAHSERGAPNAGDGILGGYQYGSGPIPRATGAESGMEKFAHRTPSSIPGNEIVEQNWLDKLARDAYYRGWKEAQQKQGEIKQRVPQSATPHSPRAWPPPFLVPNVPMVPAAKPDEHTKAPVSHQHDPHQGSNHHAWNHDHSAHLSRESRTQNWPWSQVGGSDSASWTNSGTTFDSNGEGKTGNDSRKSNASIIWGGSDKSALPSPSLASSHNWRSSRDNRSQKSGKTASTWSVPKGANTHDAQPVDSWDTTNSEWSTADSILSPRIAISRAQSLAHRSDRSQNGSHADNKSVWASEESKRAETSSSKPNSTSKSGQRSTPHGSNQIQSSQKDEKNRPEHPIPPIPIPLQSHGGQNRHHSNPPPAWGSGAHELFRSGSKKGSRHVTSPAASWATTKMDDSASFVKIVNSPAPVTSPTKSWFSGRSASKNGSVRSNWCSKEASGGGSGGQSGWAGNDIPLSMPGSWNAADDSGAKKTEGSHGKAKSATVEDSHSRNNESGENGNQNGTGWDNSNDWNNGNNDTKDEPAPQGNGWNSGWENQNNESKELPEKEGSGWSKGSKGSKAKSVQGNDAWVSSDWANGDNTSKDQADGVKDSSENDNNKPDDSWKNVGFGGVATDTGVNDWNNGDANAQNDAPGPTAWENPEPEKNDSNDRNDNNGGGFDTGWPADDNDQNKPDDTPAEGLWENGGGGGGGDDWNKGDTGGGDWNTGDNKDESKEQDGTGGDSWNVQPAFDSANDNGEQNQPSDDQNWGDNKGWGEAQSQKDNEGSKKDDAPGNGWENNNNEVKPQNDAPGWDNNPPATAPNDHKSTRSSKTRHSSSHRPRAPSTTPKEHWSFPPPAPKKLFTIAEEIESVSSTKHKSPKIPTVPPEPILTIPETKAKSEGLSHQVRAGPGTMYTHAVGRPEYIDTLERPYAVFRFKYRTRDYLRKLLGSEVPKSESAELDPVKEVEKLKVLSDEQKIEEILRLKKLVEAGGEKREEKRGNDDVDTLVKAWVGDQQERSRNNSRKSSKKGGSEGKKSAEGAKAASNQSGSKKWGDGEGGGAKPAWGEADEKSGSKQGEGDDNWGGGDGDNWGGGGAPGIW